jgi:hypothetical protein
MRVYVSVCVCTLFLKKICGFLWESVGSSLLYFSLSVKLSVSVKHVIIIFKHVRQFMRHDISINIFTLQQIEECKAKYRE